MTVNLESEVEIDLKGCDVYEGIKKTVEACLNYVDCPYEAEVNVLLTNDNEIREMNRENRDLDKSTDVLSFPLIAYDKPADFDLTEEDEIDLCNPDTGELMLGDIVISLDHVKAQAKEYGHSEERELLFLVAHSMLHLFGYDHENDDERIVMEKMQKEILDSIGVSR